MGLMHESSAKRRPLAAGPQPEDVFLLWLVGLPNAIDPLLAADAEILRLNRYQGSHPGPARLLSIFKAFRASLKPPGDHPIIQ